MMTSLLNERGQIGGMMPVSQWLSTISSVAGPVLGYK